MTPTDAKAYALKLLSLNPQVHARQIVEIRQQFLGIDEPSRRRQVDFPALQRRRAKAETALAKIRADFWTVSLPQIHSRLDVLKLEGLPDLAAAAARLKRIADPRPEFERLQGERAASAAFVEMLQQVLVLPPAQAGPRKEQSLSELAASGQLRAAKRTIRMLSKRYPQLFELEADWLGHVLATSRLAQRRIRQRPSPHQTSQSRTVPWWVIWLVYALIMGLVRLISSHK